MCTKYSVCGKSHLPKWKTSKYRRNHKGQFDRDRRLLKMFIGVCLVYLVSMIGVNTIWNWAKSLETAFVVENSKAEEPMTITWQDEVRGMIKGAGLDVALADRIIQRESWWNPLNKHRNPDGTLDRGLWMLNDYFHSEVSDSCAYNYHCSTLAAIKIWKNKGPQEWVAYRYVK